MNRKFITAFPGRRDNYQLVLALQEAGLLDGFITDLYNKGWLSVLLTPFLRSKIENRFHQDLDIEKIHVRPFYFLFPLLLQRAFQASKVAVWQDQWFSRAAVYSARSSQSHLILYEFQAEYAFDKVGEKCKKVLFQFHTHPQWEHEVLLNDTLRYPQFKEQVLRSTRQNLETKYSEHTKSAWKKADLILVASTFTKKTLLVAGADERKIVVVPYGFSERDRGFTEGKNYNHGKPFFLFVGSGSHRKGLHHLCEAWKLSGLGQSHNLHIVARVIDEGMQSFLEMDDTICWFKGVSKDELNWKYAHATAFVMPSLSEGFGQVYLEALSNGCPVIGTRESMLNDLPSHPDVSLLEAGDISGLCEEMKRVSKRKALTERERSLIAELVIPFTWERFRKGIVNAITALV